MPEMIDFGKFAQTAIAFQNLNETMRRNDIGEQGLTLEQGRLAEQQKRTELETKQLRHLQFQDLVKFSDDPRVKSNTQMSDAVLTEAGRLAEMPEIGPETLQRGRESYRRILGALQDGDQEKAHAALLDLQVMAGPKDADAILKSVKDFQGISEYSQNIESKRQLERARFEKIQGSMSKVNVGLEPYSQGVRDFTNALDGIDSPDFSKAITLSQKLPRSSANNEASFQSLVVHGNPALARFAGPGMDGLLRGANMKAAQFGQMAMQAKQQLELVEAGEPLPKGMARRDLIEQIDVGESLMNAYSDLGAWSRNPFDPTAVKHARAAKDAIIAQRKTLESTKAQAQDEVIAIRKEAQAFRETEAIQKHKQEKAIAEAQAELLRDHGYTPEPGQIAAAAMKHGVAPADILPGLADPAKKGRLDATITSGETPTKTLISSLQLEQVNIAKTKLVIDNLLTTVKQSNIGMAAALKSTTLGIAGQIEGLASIAMDDARVQTKNNKDFKYRKWFDPSVPRVDFQANTLAYMLINSEQGGRVSDKDMEEMRDRLKIKSWSAYAPDVMERLKTERDILDANESVNRRIIGRFGEAREQKPVSSMSPDEQLRELKSRSEGR